MEELQLFQGISKHNIDIVRKCLRQDIAINAIHSKYNNQTALLFASEKGKPDIIKLLLEHGADVNSKDMDGNTPLNIVCKRYSYFEDTSYLFEIIQLLLEHGSNVNSRNDNGVTPFMTACSNIIETKTFELLIKYGAEINAIDKDFWTPLMYACEARSYEEAKLLLEYGADVNSRNIDGNTALIIACDEDFTEIAKLLLENGADVNDRISNNVNILSPTYGYNNYYSNNDSDSESYYTNSYSDGDSDGDSDNYFENNDDYSGLTVLMKACKLGHKDTVQ